MSLFSREAREARAARRDAEINHGVEFFRHMAGTQDEVSGVDSLTIAEHFQMEVYGVDVAATELFRREPKPQTLEDIGNVALAS